MDHISARQIVFQDVTGQMISGGGILSVGVLQGGTLLLCQLSRSAVQGEGGLGDSPT